MIKYIVPILSIILTGCVSVSVEEPQACKQIELTVPNTFDPLVGSFSLPLNYNIDLKDLDVLDVVSFQGGSINGDDLSSVEHITITVNGTTLFDADTNGEKNVVIPPNSTNLVSSIDSNHGFNVSIVLTGTVPTFMGDWMIESNMCFYGKIDKSYGL